MSKKPDTFISEGLVVLICIGLVLYAGYAILNALTGAP